MIPQNMQTVVTADMTVAEKKQAMQDSIHENKICSMVGQELQKHYPGWRWYVECKLCTGLVGVRNLSLDGDYGFYIPLLNLLNETYPRLVMQAGGEILERYRLERGMMPKDMDIKRDFTGAAIGDKDD